MKSAASHKVGATRRNSRWRVRSWRGSASPTPSRIPARFTGKSKAKEPAATELSDQLRALWKQAPVLGLTAQEGIPTSPNGPALACRLHISEAATTVTLHASHPAGTDWINLGKLAIKASQLAPNADETAKASTPITSEHAKERDAVRLSEAVTEGILSRLVHVQLSHGPRDKGKETFRIKILNESPMILNGLALGGSAVDADNPPSVLAGLSVPPLKSLTVGASVEMVKRLRLKDGTRAFAARPQRPLRNDRSISSRFRGLDGCHGSYSTRVRRGRPALVEYEQWHPIQQTENRFKNSRPSERSP